MTPKKNGWYEFKPKPEKMESEEAAHNGALMVHQIVHIIDGLVMVTMSKRWWTIEQAKELGEFIQKIELTGN